MGDTNDKLRDPALRIAKAIELISKSCNSTGGVQRDLLAEYEAIQGWIWLPSLYSVIEQGLKLIVQSYGTAHGRGHRLTKAYDNLKSKHKEHLRNAYKAYVSLHDYIPHKKIRDFLNQIDTGPDVGGKLQDGYTAWRYFLLDGFPKKASDQPRNSVGAMLEIATAIRCILEDEFIRSKRSASPTNVIGRLHNALHRRMFRMATDYCSDASIQEKVVSGKEELIDHFQHGYSNLYQILTENVDYVIQFLSRSVIGPGFTPAGGELGRLSEFMKGYDREGFLQFAIKVKEGERSFPNHTFYQVTKDSGSGE